MPRVTIKDGARSLVTDSPLISPNVAPISAVTINRMINGPSDRSKRNFTVPYMPTTRIEVKETSGPPTTRTRKNPIARRPITVLFFRREKIL